MNDRLNVRVLVITWLCFFSTVSGSAFDYTGRSSTETRHYWNSLGKETLIKAANIKPNIAVAKNVILFLGDGMGVSTVTAARIYKGQQEGQLGEESELSFEKFPHIALSKTYNQDYQTPDSAGTATAFLCGVKTNRGVIGVDARSRRGDCSSVPGTELESVLEQSMKAGKSVGIVSTARVTHATPAGTYAHTSERDWESAYDMTGENDGTCKVKDIATQLVDDHKHVQVILGGGRRAFIPPGSMDVNLTMAWQDHQKELSRKYHYVSDKAGFDTVDPSTTDSILGLFTEAHMSYEADRNHTLEPSITEMTDKAIRILNKNPKGYFLLVEGGRIDHAHHNSNAYRSLLETVVFAEAVERAVNLTSDEDTLIVTTADHSHTFTIGGYPHRGNDILGLIDDVTGDDKPYTTLMYANGPGAWADETKNTRPDITHIDTSDKDYLQQSAVPLDSETHGGEDVAIYARGPMSHLFHGVHEQHYIAHVMAYASCVGLYENDNECAQRLVNDKNKGSTNSATRFKINQTTILLTVCIFIYVNFIKGSKSV